MIFNPGFQNKFNPAVRKVWLHISAGLGWLAVGLMPIGFASRWLKPVDFSTVLSLVAIGLLLAIGIYFFAIQGWTSYPLVLFMIFLGIYLRTYSPFPKPLLAILYLGIGGGHCLPACTTLSISHGQFGPRFPWYES